jgi:hypothetical protein
MDLSDHCLGLFKVKAKGDVEEDTSEDDPNAPKLLFFGTLPDDKSRYPKQKKYLLFDSSNEEGAITLAKDPIEETLDKVYEGVKDSLKDKDADLDDPDSYFPNTGEFIELIHKILEIPKDKDKKGGLAKKYIKQGETKGYWIGKKCSDKKGQPTRYHLKHLSPPTGDK